MFQMSVDTCKVSLSLMLKVRALDSSVFTVCYTPIKNKKNGRYKYAYTLVSLKKINTFSNSVFSIEGGVKWD